MGDLDIGRAAGNHLRRETAVLHRGGLIAHALPVGYCQPQGRVQLTQPEHLRRQGAPAGLPLQRLRDDLLPSRGPGRGPDRSGGLLGNPLEGIDQRHGQQGTATARLRGRNQAVQIALLQARPGGIVHQHPIGGAAGLQLGNRIESPQHRLHPLLAPGGHRRQLGMPKIEARPVGILRGNPDHEVIHLRVLAQPHQAVFQHGFTRQPAVLFRGCAVHPPTAPGGGHHGPDTRTPINAERGLSDAKRFGHGSLRAMTRRAIVGTISASNHSMKTAPVRPALFPMSASALLQPPLPHSGHEIVWGGLHGAATGLSLVEAMQQADAPLLVVLDDARQLQMLQLEIEFFYSRPTPAMPVAEFPSWECLPYDRLSPHRELVSERLRLLHQLPQLRRGIVLTTGANLMQRLPPREYIMGHSFSLKVGQQLAPDALRARLSEANYAAVQQVAAPGEFAVRGGLIDVFPMGEAQPMRLDLFDDELESIRYFDVDTQKSTGQTSAIELLPAHEFPMTEQGITTFRQAFRRTFAGDPRKHSVYQQISKGFAPAGSDFFLPLFFSHTHSLFDYLPPQTVVVVESALSEHTHLHWDEIRARYEHIRYDPEYQLLEPEKLYLPPTELLTRLAQFSRIVLAGEHATPQWRSDSRPPPSLPVNPSQALPYAALIEQLQQTDQRTLLVVETPGRREAMQELLQANGYSPTTVAHFDEFVAHPDMRLGLSVCALERGLSLQRDGRHIQVITESQLYDERVLQRRRRSQQARNPDSLIRSLTELQPGDPVVHVDHGVGRYAGLHRIDLYGEESEFVTLEYQHGDKLYVPVMDLHLITQFIGGTEENAPLHRLGGEGWGKAKKRAREKAYDAATDLLEIEALRAAREGRQFSLPKAEYEAFVARFPFEETPDQMQAIGDVLADMQADAPMDRLICGDVGFGKTEVAMRAVFVAVMNGAQVAMLVPTTLLAQQHYQNFLDRFADLSISIELLSRFRGKAQNDAVVARLQQGRIDIVIGTHKLLQNEVGFADLGLLIIDEEHRFGVRQKDTIKRLRSQVDILTLTATPIPRTLNLTLSGLRSISIIATSPQLRRSIKTVICDHNPGLIREACLREIRRGGQVYFLHNNVRSIERAADELAELIPEAAIRFGHGQMNSLRMERIMQDFYHQRFNVLVCTTIIESGIDVPSANTIIIHRADKFGLAQLHQLRGRVGRSHHQAFAYLMVPARGLMTRDAQQRLDAIASMEHLGAGFTLASYDLEIRGAGELLGETQSGLIDDIGFSLYNDYLRQAIASIRRNELPGVDENRAGHSVHIDLHLTALFPGDYLANAHTRLVLYKRIAGAIDDAQLDELQIEIIDRFGLLPESAKNLFRLTSIRLQAEQLGIVKIDVGEHGGRFELAQQHCIDPARIIQLVQTAPNEYRLLSPDTFGITTDLQQPEERLNRVEALLEMLHDQPATEAEQQAHNLSSAA